MPLGTIFGGVAEGLRPAISYLAEKKLEQQKAQEELNRQLQATEAEKNAKKELEEYLRGLPLTPEQQAQVDYYKAQAERALAEAKALEKEGKGGGGGGRGGGGRGVIPVSDTQIMAGMLENLFAISANTTMTPEQKRDAFRDALKGYSILYPSLTSKVAQAFTENTELGKIAREYSQTANPVNPVNPSLAYQGYPFGLNVPNEWQSTSKNSVNQSSGKQSSGKQLSQKQGSGGLLPPPPQSWGTPGRGYMGR